MIRAEQAEPDNAVMRSGIEANKLGSLKTRSLGVASRHAEDHGDNGPPWVPVGDCESRVQATVSRVRRGGQHEGVLTPCGSLPAGTCSGRGKDFQFM